MDKNKILELLARKMAGEASQQEMDELNELMNRFPDAVYYEEFLEQIWNTSTQVDGHITDHENAYELHRSKYAKEFLSRKKLIGSLFVAVVIVLLSFIYFNQDKTSIRTIEIAVGKGVRKTVNLPDGTVVWLNSNSNLSYASNFCDKPIRAVFLSGEAYFDVAHQKNLPFVVQTKMLSIRVLGTVFNVQAYPSEKKSEATLIQGAIELTVNSRPKQKILLNPSEKFALEECDKGVPCDLKQKHVKSDITLTIKQVKPVLIGYQRYIEEVAWKDSLLVFKNDSFEELKPKLERWFDVKVVVDEKVPKFYRFTGILKNEDINEALTAMQLIKPFKFKLNANEVIIY